MARENEEEECEQGGNIPHKVCIEVEAPMRNRLKHMGHVDAVDLQ